MPIESVTAGTNQNLQQQNIDNIMNEYLRIKTEQNNIINNRKIEEVDINTKNDYNKTTTKTIIDENKVLIFTRYDEKGKEINRVPPGYINKI